jgi:myo-inositol-1(or 4)-monophosphatase
LPLFATNIALVEDGELVVAAVADGATGDICVAERGRGAWFVDSSGLRAIHVSDRYRTLSVDPTLGRRPGLADFPTSFALQAIEQRRWDVRILSSTIALVYVATGRLAAAVFVPMDAALHVAAGALLAQEAGATVTDHAGAPWRRGSHILLVAAPALHPDLQRLVQDVYAKLNGGCSAR